MGRGMKEERSGKGKLKGRDELMGGGEATDSVKDLVVWKTVTLYTVSHRGDSSM